VLLRMGIDASLMAALKVDAMSAEQWGDRLGKSREGRDGPGSTGCGSAVTDHLHPVT